jgi:hypothetical protein
MFDIKTEEHLLNCLNVTESSTKNKMKILIFELRYHQDLIFRLIKILIRN